MYLVLPVCIVISDVIGVPPQREEARQREEALGGVTPHLKRSKNLV